MTVNTDLLICSLGKTYSDLVEEGIISYKSEPRGASGSPILNLSMAKEGLFLTFDRKDKVFSEVTLRLKNKNVKDWFFPNILPFPLKGSMTREWIHKELGQPDKAKPPQIIANINFGWIERFTTESFKVPLVMLINYDLDESVESVTFYPFTELRW